MPCGSLQASARAWPAAATGGRQLDLYSALPLQGLGQGVTASANREASYDWEGRHWVVPLNLSGSKVTKLGSQMVGIAGGVRYYLESPAGGPTWGLRLTFTLLFPR
jgi:hypothetical protein